RPTVIDWRPTRRPSRTRRPSNPRMGHAARLENSDAARALLGPRNRRQWQAIRNRGGSMISTSSMAGLILALGSILLVGCSAPADQRSPGQSPGGPAPMAVKSPVSINAEMVRIVDHAGHQLWNAEREGMAPKTDADWENVIEHATQIAAAGALIRLEGTG